MKLSNRRFAFSKGELTGAGSGTEERCENNTYDPGLGWTTDDADDCQGSGSFSFPSTASIAQCLQVEPDTRYYFGVRYKQPAEQSVFCNFVTYDDTLCEGETMGGDSLIGAGTVVNAWAIAAKQFDVPSGARSALFACHNWSGSVLFYQAYVNTSDNY